MKRLLREGRWFPLLIVGGFLGLSVTMNAVLLVKASSDPSFAVEKDYYRKAKAWDRHHAEALAAERLGWEVSASWVQGAHGPVLHLRIRDAEGEPVAGARVQVRAFHAAQAVRIFEGEARALEPGLYAFERLVPRAGIWVVRLRVRRDEALWVGERRVELRLQGG